MMSFFPALVYIDLECRALPPRSGTEVDYIRTVAAQCHALERMVLRRFNMPPLDFRIMRGGHSALSSVDDVKVEKW
jgi:hypothetical protein